MVVNPGDKIPLSAFLADYDQTKYVRAYLYSQGLPFSTPYVNLTHIAKGRYADESVTMPGAILHAVYQVFLDSSYTTLADYYGGADVFQPVALTKQVGELEAAIESFELEGSVEVAEVGGEAEPAATAEGEIETLEVTGQVESNQADAEVGEQDIEGEAGC